MSDELVSRTLVEQARWQADQWQRLWDAEHELAKRLKAELDELLRVDYKGSWEWSEKEICRLHDEIKNLKTDRNKKGPHRTWSWRWPFFRPCFT